MCLYMKNSVNCILIFLGPFPKGNVSTLRVMSYCKSLVKKGVNVKILIIAPTSEASVNIDRIGFYEGVEFEYLSKITWKNPNPFITTKFCYYVYGVLLSLKIIYNYKATVLLTYHSELLSNLIYRIFCYIYRIPFIIDKTEYPVGYMKGSFLKKKLEILKLKFFDGYISITDELRLFYLDTVNVRPESFFLLPMTIDVGRFENAILNTPNNKYIAVVFGTHNRDNLFITVKSYYEYFKLSKKPFKLILIGDFETLMKSHAKSKEILDFIIENKLTNNIDFKGLIPQDEVPSILANASCLLSTPSDFVSGGFPTKLGEYLLSGVPVVTTSIGEIPKYIKHYDQALLSPINDVKHIANNILYLEQNVAQGKKMALNALHAAKIVFNADTYCGDLIKFITSFKKI